MKVLLESCLVRFYNMSKITEIPGGDKFIMAKLFGCTNLVILKELIKLVIYKHFLYTQF